MAKNGLAKIGLAKVGLNQSCVEKLTSTEKEVENRNRRFEITASQQMMQEPQIRPTQCRRRLRLDAPESELFTILDLGESHQWQPTGRVLSAIHIDVETDSTAAIGIDSRTSVE